MGVTGPIPQRSHDTVRRNKPAQPIATITAIGIVEKPDLGDISFQGETHPLVVELYQAMKDSAQAKYFEPSDWQYARLTLYALNEELVHARRHGRTMGAMKLSSLNQMLTSLLLTEGDRRRVQIEVDRNSGTGPTGEVGTVAQLFRQRFEADKNT